MAPPTVYLVLPPAIGALGGAEKRFAGLWYLTAQRGAGNIKLVASDALLDGLSRVDEFPGFGEFRAKTVPIRLGSNAHLAWALACVRLREPEAVFHLVNQPPTLLTPLLAPHRTVFSVTAAALWNFSRRFLAATIAGSLASAFTDFLDPDLANTFRRWMPFRAASITTTANSFVDLDAYDAPPAAERRPHLVFLGTFLERKQVFRLLEAVPALHAGLVDRGHHEVMFYFLGRDVEGPPLAERARALGCAEVVKIHYTERPQEVLSSSRVFFSLQLTENYPSRALLEAMACGCLPVVTDVGKSRRIAQDDFAWFVPQDFSETDLLEACDAILSLPAAEFDRRVALARAFMAERFAFDTMAAYFQSLYQRVAEGGLSWTRRNAG